jgi:Flp pilus assembly pilin Flp
MIKFIKNFRKDEDGAVTVDWVVLTAAVVGLGVAAYSAIEQETNQLSADIAATIEAENVTADETIAAGTAGG